jgi:hypothetical protein
MKDESILPKTKMMALEMMFLMSYIYIITPLPPPTNVLQPKMWMHELREEISKLSLVYVPLIN